jgi:hypothetical protein
VRNCGNWQILFSGSRSERDRGSNVVGFQGGEVGENVFGGISGSEARENRAECDAGSFEDGFAATYTRVAHDLLFVIFGIPGHEMSTFWRDCIIHSRIEDKPADDSETRKEKFKMQSVPPFATPRRMGIRQKAYARNSAQAVSDYVPNHFLSVKRKLARVKLRKW